MKDQTNNSTKNIKIFLWISISCILLLAAGAIIGVLVLQKPDEETQITASIEENLNTMHLFSEEETPEMILQVEEKNGYELISVEDNKDYTVGIFKVYAPDLYSVAKNVDQSLPDSENLEEVILNELSKAPIIETEVSVIFTETDDGLTPILTSDFIDAYYGGIYRLYEEYLQSLVTEVQ